MNTSEILTRAADLIEERGWTTGWYIDECGGLCVRGALYVAAGVEPLPQGGGLFTDLSRWPGYTYEREQAVYDITLLLDAHVSKPVERWNDAQGRTKEEVINALRGAAEAARAEQ